MQPAHRHFSKLLHYALVSAHLSGVWGLYCASRGDFHKDEGKPIISLFILSQSTLGIYSMLMNASSPRELPFSGWGIAESFAKAVLADPAAQMLDPQSQRRFMSVGMHVKHTRQHA